jgi:hypothetical protein
LDAAMIRMSTWIGIVPPTRWNDLSWRTRSSLPWVAGVSSPISSRNTVPPSPSSNLPIARADAPVKAPRSCPNSSLSSSVSGIAAQLIATKRAAARGRELVDRAREELLAGSALSLEEHRRVGRGDALDLRAHGADRRRLADDRRQRVGRRLREEQRLARARAALDRARGRAGAAGPDPRAS